MKRVCVIALLIAGTAFGQGFSNLATNLDGSVLYFSTPLTWSNSTDYSFWPKVFEWDSASGFSLFDERPSAVPFPLGPFDLPYGTTKPFQVFAPEISSDGSVVADTAVSFCYGSDNCAILWELYQSTIYRPGQPTIVAPGSAVLSRNGRYALIRSSVVGFGGFHNDVQMTLLDLQTGLQTSALDVPGPLAEKHRVADDGAIAVGLYGANGASNGGFEFGQMNQLKIVPTPVTPPSPLAYNPDPVNPLINTAASLVIYQAGGGSLGPATLSAYSPASGTSTTLVTETAAAPDFRASISDDGSLVAFVYGANSQMYVIGSSGTGLRQITTFSEPVTEIELSGDGTVAFVVTAANRISRVIIATAQATDIVPPTPYTNVNEGVPYRVSRGTVTSISGSGFAATATAQPPYPLSLDNVELQAAGLAVPIGGVSPTSISYPATWDLTGDAPTAVEVLVLSASASPFVPGFLVEPPNPAPLAAVHQDYSPILSSSPPRPGETIHVFAKDLGPVVPAPLPGVPGPFQPLSELAVPISCVLSSVEGFPPPSGSIPVNVSFAGLAPGLLNAFQVDVVMPASFDVTPNALLCEIGDASIRYPFGVSLNGQ